MRILYTVLTLAPAPLFFAGFIYSVINPSPHCGHDFQMPAMWLIMSLAHCVPWILRWQQRNFTRNWKTAVICALRHCIWFPVVYLQQILSICRTPYQIADTYHTHRTLNGHCGIVFSSGSQQLQHPVLIAVNTFMLYILLIDRENSMEFWVYDCAVIYQQILGGEIYAVPQPPSDVEQL